MRLTYFGRLGDVAGQPEEQVPLPPAVRDSDALRRWLDERFGCDDFTSEAVRVAIDDRLVVRAAPLAPTNHVAFLPPVGGG